ncbi:heavy metal-associated domain-containing protein [Sulfurimonas sp. HSL3-7]|uniref:heavy-metal-associated domain-containing protein n=1 Tax=Sulfonitrofixus jiaomeiensis TaxID=3131938 RepID=UPI0031F86934
MRPLLLLGLPLWLWGETLSLYEVPKMHCPLCTVAVKKSLKALDGVHRAEVRLNTKEARVWHDDALSNAALSEAISKTGYEGILVSREPIEAP